MNIHSVEVKNFKSINDLKILREYVISPVEYDSGEKSTDTVYSDRLYQWDPEKYNELCKKHFGNMGQYWSNRKPKLIEAFLCDYIGKPVTLTKVELTENVSTGYPIWIFFYK